MCSVGAWRLLDVFEELKLPVSLLVNSEIYNHCPELPAEYCKRIKHCEVIGHGQSNACKQVLEQHTTCKSAVPPAYTPNALAMHDHATEIPNV